jgi:hypothetical protein
MPAHWGEQIHPRIHAFPVTRTCQEHVQVADAPPPTRLGSIPRAGTPAGHRGGGVHCDAVACQAGVTVLQRSILVASSPGHEQALVDGHGGVVEGEDGEHPGVACGLRPAPDVEGIWGAVEGGGPFNGCCEG